MKARPAWILIFFQLFEANAEVILKRLTEGQAVVISCSPWQAHGGLTGLHLYHRGVQSQTTLVSVTEAGEVTVATDHRARLVLRGDLSSMKVNVTISRLELSDTGLYMWDLSYRDTNSSDQMILCAQKTFVLVEVAGRPCHCSPGYAPLLWTIFTAAGLLLLTLTWLAIQKCVKLRSHRKPQPHAPIYEEMGRKQQHQSPRGPQNNHEAPSHLEEVNFPVYANPNIRQLQDNYYACPRQLKLRD
ncbi:uncharacterized protein LOC113020888 [Astatotilapia calliptera]|uniref:uncharacterized protein LOC113020888 n=1 Tax=Astatotilapia calliptera TaxID=8154 RepID=UPI000329B621|nr:uncharacterized protein LOC113020888 [Astatotilapia calliptera]